MARRTRKAAAVHGAAGQDAGVRAGGAADPGARRRGSWLFDFCLLRCPVIFWLLLLGILTGLALVAVNFLPALGALVQIV